jgi:hypothetical protein
MKYSLTSTSTATKVAVVLLLGMAAVQVCIAAGMVPITIVWGGSQQGDQELKMSLRVASMAASAILFVFAHILWSRGTEEDPPQWIRVGSWGVTLYMIFNTVGNLASNNGVERVVFGALTVLLAICSWRISSSLSSERNASLSDYASIDK